MFTSQADTKSWYHYNFLVYSNQTETTTTTKTTNLGKGGQPDFQSFYIFGFKFLVFNKKT